MRCQTLIKDREASLNLIKTMSEKLSADYERSLQRLQKQVV